MATVKRKKKLKEAIDQTKRTYIPGVQRSMVDPMLGQVSTTMPAQTGGLSGQNIPSQVGGLSGVTTTNPQLGGLSGMNEGGMKNQIDVMEMEKQSKGAAPAPMTKAKAKVKTIKKIMEWREFKKMNPSANFDDYFSYVGRTERSNR
jgi:hypothetical protein